MQAHTANPQRLDGKVAVITGAAGAIGEATARLFLDLGAKVMLTDCDHLRLAEAQERLGGGEACSTSSGDCADETVSEAVVAATIQRFGKLDIMVANAGVEGALKPIEHLSFEEFAEVLRVNVLGVWLAIKCAAAPMKAAGGGAIVAVSSVGGVIGFPEMAPYIASKHAVLGLVKTAAIELAPANIRVNAVAPGPVDNRMMQSLGDQLGGGDPTAFRTFLEGRIPMGRYGRNEEIAHLVAFLASDAASYCTGGLCLADGGYVAA